MAWPECKEFRHESVTERRPSRIANHKKEALLAFPKAAAPHSLLGVVNGGSVSLIGRPKAEGQSRKIMLSQCPVLSLRARQYQIGTNYARSGITSAPCLSLSR